MRWLLKSTASPLLARLLVQVQIKENITGLCAGNSPVTGEFPAQKASNVENVSISWCHHTWFEPMVDALTAEEYHYLLDWSQWIHCLCLLWGNMLDIQGLLHAFSWFITSIFKKNYIYNSLVKITHCANWNKYETNAEFEEQKINTIQRESSRFSLRLLLTGLILGLRLANERRHYFVTTSLIGWAQT